MSTVTTLSPTPKDCRLPVHKAFALQVGQRRAELVGKEDESGQVQAVLPHLQEGAQLHAVRQRREERVSF